MFFLLLANCSLSLFSEEPWKIYTVDTLKFDTIYEYLINDTSGSNLWQIGTPDKLYFDSAFSKPFAIVTDTVNFYEVNNWSYFDLYIGYFNYKDYYLHDISVELKHKYDTDALRDGGYFTVSYDMGLSWMNIIKDTEDYWEIKPDHPIYSAGLYSADDTLFNGEYGFSGKSNDWDTVIFKWHAFFPGLKSDQIDWNDTMIIRFNFISDSIDTGKEGWMIDDIRLYAHGMGGGGIHIADNSKIIKLSPNPVSSFVKLEFDKGYKDIGIKIYNIKGNLLRGYYYTNRNQIKIDNIGLENGFYFISVNLNQQTSYTKKFIIKR